MQKRSDALSPSGATVHQEQVKPCISAEWHQEGNQTLKLCTKTLISMGQLANLGRPRTWSFIHSQPQALIPLEVCLISNLIYHQYSHFWRNLVELYSNARIEIRTCLKQPSTLCLQCSDLVDGKE